MKKLILILILVLVLAAGSAMGAEVIYTNDFGTQAQFDEFFKWAGTRFAVAGPVGTVPYPEVGSDYIPGVDLDGDGLSSSAAVTSDGLDGGWYTGRLTVIAPTGYYITNPYLEGLAGGKSNVSNFVKIEMSNDGGTTFIADDTRWHGDGEIVTNLRTIGVGDEWENLTSVVIQFNLGTFYLECAAQNLGVLQNLKLSGLLVPIDPTPDFLPGDANGDGVVSAGDYAAVQANFGATLGEQGATTPEPATMSLMAIAGMALIRRKNK